MTFMIIMCILGGLLLIYSGIENQSIASYAATWIGGK